MKRLSGPGKGREGAPSTGGAADDTPAGGARGSTRTGLTGPDSAARPVRVRWSALLAVSVLGVLAACERGPRYCIFDGTTIGAAPVPFVAMNPDGTVDEKRSRYTWREFTWPTDPAWTHVRPDGGEWLFEGTTDGVPWTFRGVFTADAGGAFVRLGATGVPPPVQVVGRGGKPTLLLYRVRPCREFEGSQSGVRTCTRWGAEVNARTQLTCD